MEVIIDDEVIDLDEVDMDDDLLEPMEDLEATLDLTNLIDDEEIDLEVEDE